VRRNPSFSAVAIATLALGIGGVAAMFSVVDAVLIRPLPYYRAEGLVTLWDDLSMSRTGEPKIPSTPFEWIQWRRFNTVFTDLAATQPAEATLTGEGEPEQLPARHATWNLCTVLGVQPMFGRTFTEDEDTRGVRVAMISFRLWQRRFNGVARCDWAQDYAERQPLRNHRSHAPRLLLPAVARYRRLAAGFVSPPGCERAQRGTMRSSSRDSSPE